MLTPQQFTLYEQLLSQSTVESFSEPRDKEELVHKGILLTLYQESSPKSIALLIQAAHTSPYPPVRSACISLLGDLSQKKHSAALEGLFDLAVTHNQLEALAQIRSASLLSTRNSVQAIYYLLSGQVPEYRHLDPHNTILTEFFFNRMDGELQERLLKAAGKANLKDWLILVYALRPNHPEPLMDLVVSFGNFSIEHQKLSLFWLNQFAKLESSACEDAICQIFIQNESTLALELAKQEGYFPNSPVQAALFYFLSNNWQAYTQLDFNHALISRAYETASHPVRKRILEVSRLSGRQEWMNSLSSAARIVWLDDLNDPDWEITLRTLSQAQRYDELWRLAQLAPPLWSARLISELNTANWHPPSTPDEQRWQHLVTASSACLGQQPKIQPLAVWRSPSPDISCLALNSQANLIAAGGSESSIYLWETGHQHTLVARLGSPVAQMRSLAFSPDGEFLVVAPGDHALRTFRLKDTKLIKTMEGHTALVHNLVFHPDGRSLISASFDGSLRTWRFPQGQLLNTIDLGKTEVFGLAVSPDGLILIHAGSDQAVNVRRWPSGEALFHLTGHQDTVINLSSAPNGPVVASASRDRQMMVWNYLAGRRLAQFSSGGEPTTQMMFHPTHPVLIIGGLQGSLSIRSMTSGASLAQIKGHTAAITGLVTDSSGARIFTSSLDGVICLWDLRVFLAVRQPQSHTLVGISALTSLQKSCQAKSAEYDWLEFMMEMIRWRQQFDIQIDEAPMVMSIGEFDIQL